MVKLQCPTVTRENIINSGGYYDNSARKSASGGEDEDIAIHRETLPCSSANYRASQADHVVRIRDLVNYRNRGLDSRKSHSVGGERGGGG